MEKERACRNCEFIGFTERKSNIGRCVKWAKMVNLSSDYHCYKPVIKETQMEFNQSNIQLKFNL